MEEIIGFLTFAAIAIPTYLYFQRDKKSIGIDLEIFFKTELSDQLEGLGVNTTTESAEIRIVRFYEISSIAPYRYDGQELTTIYSGSEAFVANYTFNELCQILDGK